MSLSDDHCLSIKNATTTTTATVPLCCLPDTPTYQHSNAPSDTKESNKDVLLHPRDHDEKKHHRKSSHKAQFKATFYNPFETKHRRRTSPSQTSILEAAFDENPKPSAAKRQSLAEELKMTPRGVQIWFQNRRAKAKQLLLQQQQQQQQQQSSFPKDRPSTRKRQQYHIGTFEAGIVPKNNNTAEWVSSVTSDGSSISDDDAFHVTTRVQAPRHATSHDSLSLPMTPPTPSPPPPPPHFQQDPFIDCCNMQVVDSSLEGGIYYPLENYDLSFVGQDMAPVTIDASATNYSYYYYNNDNGPLVVHQQKPVMMPQTRPKDLWLNDHQPEYIYTQPCKELAEVTMNKTHYADTTQSSATTFLTPGFYMADMPAW